MSKYSKVKRKETSPLTLQQFFIGNLEPTRRQTITEGIPTWLVFVAYLAYLRSIRPQPPSEINVLRSLIIVTGLVLVVVALVAAGAPDEVSQVIKHWPIIP